MNTNEDNHNSFVIIWLNSNIDQSNKNYQNQIIKLEKIFNHTIYTFIDVNQCRNFLINIKKELKVFLIIECYFEESTISILHLIDQLDSIYIYCQHTEKEHNQWINNWFKIKGIYNNIESISNILIHDTKRWDLVLISISIFTSTDNFNKLDSSLIYSQLLTDILRQIQDNNDQAKKIFIDFIRLRYADNNAQLKIIDEFENDYHLHSPVWWYTRDIFIYSMINLALRTQDIEIIMKMAFFMRDLHQQIEQLYHQQFESNNQKLVVYRGQKLSKNDFELLHKNIGGLLSFNNFMSTSANRNVGHSLYADSARQDLTMIPILFSIEIDSTINSTSFASIKDISYFGSVEEEILFSMHAIFRIGDINKIDDRLWEVQLTLASNHDQQLKQLKQTIEQDIQDGNEWHRLTRLMIKLGKYDKAEQICTTLLNLTSNTNQEDISTYYTQMGYINEENGNLKIALKYYKMAQQIQERCFAFDDPRLSILYNNIGVLYQTMSDYPNALLFMEKTRQIREQTLPSNDIKLGSIYNNLGCFYRLMKDYTKAISFYEKTLKIFQEKLSSIDPRLATCYNNIAETYHYMGQFSRAIFFCEKELEIQQRSLPIDHPDLATTYTNLARAYQSQKEFSIAMTFYQKTIEIRKKSSSENHPHMVLTYNNIGLLHQSIKEYTKAISFFEKVLEIQEKYLIDTHPDLVTTYKNLALTYKLMGDNNKALSLLNKVINIGEKSPSENYQSLFGAYNNIGQIYHDFHDCINALHFYKQALEIAEKYLSENYLSISTGYFNIAMALDDLQQYSNAIVNCERAIDIGRHCFEPNHPNMKIFRDNLQRIRQKLSK